MFKVIVGISQPIFCVGIVGVLSSVSGFEVIQQCADWNALREAVERHSSALIIASTRVVDSLSRLLSLAQEKNSRILLIVEDTESCLRYDGTGVAGVLRRSSEIADLLNHSRNIWSGIRFMPPTVANPVKRDTVGANVVRRLTRTELRVVSFVMGGMKNRGIAEAMATTEQAVRDRLRSIFDKVGVSGRVELALYAIHHPAVHMAAADVAAGFDVSPARPFAASA